MNTTIRQGYQWAPNRFIVTSLVAAVMSISGLSIASAQDKPEMTKSAGLTTLITETPEAGFALAIKLSQKGVATTQTDANIRKALRPSYAHDANSLIAVSHVIATHFQTIAAANEYWRK